MNYKKCEYAPRCGHSWRCKNSTPEAILTCPFRLTLEEEDAETESEVRISEDCLMLKVNSGLVERR